MGFWLRFELSNYHKSCASEPHSFILEEFPSLRILVEGVSHLLLWSPKLHLLAFWVTFTARDGKIEQPLGGTCLELWTGSSWRNEEGLQRIHFVGGWWQRQQHRGPGHCGRARAAPSGSGSGPGGSTSSSGLLCGVVHVCPHRTDFVMSLWLYFWKSLVSLPLPKLYLYGNFVSKIF